ncbi:MAG: L-threonylcarbamoyladenylate synthase [Burkholderiaceae bacterium]|nr:L-threonylcarbamoyladenylate synthase [Burkholderiaceae bacterium]
MPRLLAPHSAHPGADDLAVQAAAAQLARGALLGLPTETVYGLAADATQANAVQRIFVAKGRPTDHPLIVHLPVRWEAGVAHFAAEVPAFARALMRAFWPGPLTVILPRQPGVAAAAAGGQASVGLRCPAHPVAQAVLQAAQAQGVMGVAAPSANRFGRVSPTTAQHVVNEFDALSGDELLVLDGGACAVGIESTIIDATRGHPVLLRPGMLTPAQLEAACGQPLRLPHEVDSQPAPRASGTLESHYAPRARVRLMPEHQLHQALDQATSTLRPGKVAVYATQRPAQPELLWRPMPTHAADCARELFAVLRELDDQGVDTIWVQSPPGTPDWQGVSDRLLRAAA